MKKINVELLCEILNYDPNTGEFRWRISGNGRRLRDIAGSLNSKGYIVIGINGQIYYAHRLAWLWTHGTWPADQIDHINGDRADNRLSNLREATRSLNAQNIRTASKDSASGFLGISFRKDTGRWQARIQVKDRRLSLGYFSTPEEASAAYLTAKRRLHEGCTI